jgi:hypothetical protein
LTGGDPKCDFRVTIPDATGGGAPVHGRDLCYKGGRPPGFGASPPLATRAGTCKALWYDLRPTGAADGGRVAAGGCLGPMRAV